MRDDCFLQTDTSIVISAEGSSRHDLRLDYVKLSYLDTLNKIYDLGPRIDPHISMFLDSFKNVVLILLIFR